MQKITVTALAAISALAVTASASAQPSAIVQRGDYLVNGVAGCNDCHTQMGPQGPDITRSLQGATLGFAPTAPIPWAPAAPPIAGGPAGMTDGQFINFLKTGVRPDGSHPLPPMPSYRMNDEDARAIVAYVRSIPSGR